MFSADPTFIQPKIFNCENVATWFSMKNPEIERGVIRGFNLGIHTEDTEEAIAENLSILSKLTQTKTTDIALTKQIHSNIIQVVTQGGMYKDVDALVTSQQNVLLSIQVADCAAVLLADEESGVIGAAHAGWRGAVANIVPNTIQEMQQLGAIRSKMKAYLSVCIGLESFEVGEEVAEQFPKQFVDYENYSKPHVDLKAFLFDQLMQEGLNPESIEVEDGCTYLNNDQFYSFRKEGKDAGRMMALIKLKTST